LSLGISSSITIGHPTDLTCDEEKDIVATTKQLFVVNFALKISVWLGVEMIGD